MYLSFFGLSEKPFAITPDPRYLYLSERHAEALAHLLYGINESGGFIQLTGEVGTGKTTVVRTLLSRVPHHADVAVILNPRVTPVEFLLTICEELGLGVDEADRNSVKEMVDALNRRLLSAHADGRRVIVIVDEAQNLSAEVLEQVRLLTNLETPTQKLLQIILIGQPELRELLDRTDLRQLAQRITGRYHLKPLSREETQQYVRHRLRVAGAAGEIFTPAALARSASAVGRDSASHQCVLRSRAARRLHTGKTRRSRQRWFAVQPAKCTAGSLRRCGWDGSPPQSCSPGLGTTALVGLRAWQHQTSAPRSALKATPSIAAHPPHPPHTRAPARHPPAQYADRPSRERPPPLHPLRPPPSINALLAANAAGYHRCGGFSPLAVSLGIGDGERSRPVRPGREGRTRLLGTARFLGTGARAQSAGHPDPHR